MAQEIADAELAEALQLSIDEKAKISVDEELARKIQAEEERIEKKRKPYEQKSERVAKKHRKETLAALKELEQSKSNSLEEAKIEPSQISTTKPTK